ncbi:hypothetical protein GCM10011491_44710 [Brucella endophytica]|uniref:Uncharacterized protein n=1 Tax=Brucella endophytica TaxID=1963359 RepID=A0A916SQX0_9HYPH|nr:hypothetical protein [Brucella endophytica]GGB11848.1 hypothetical protein GCM10011491_44710 [Brucella endophytica]
MLIFAIDNKGGDTMAEIDIEARLSYIVDMLRELFKLVDKEQ